MIERFKGCMSIIAFGLFITFVITLLVVYITITLSKEVFLWTLERLYPTPMNALDK